MQNIFYGNIYLVIYVPCILTEDILKRPLLGILGGRGPMMGNNPGGHPCTFRSQYHNCYFKKLTRM
jgi:hypothetical protein